MYSLGNLSRLTLNNETVIELMKLYQFKGKDFFYEDVMKHDIDHVTKDVIEREAFYFSKYLNLNLTESRTRLILRKNVTPKNNDERILANAKNVFTILHEDPEDFILNSNEVYRMNETLFKNVKKVQFKMETVIEQNNLLQERKKVSKRQYLDELLHLYEKNLNSGKVELTNLIVNFYIDFINMDLFESDNDIIGLLLLYAFLYRERFNLFQYISFFELLYNNQESFKKAVIIAEYNWNEGYSQTTQLHTLLIKMLLDGYNKAEKMVRDYQFDQDLNKADNVENTIMKLGETFTKDEIRNKSPYISESTINRTLKRLRDENKIRPNGVGRSATWIKLVHTDRFEVNARQMDLFEYIMNDKEDE